MIRIGVVCLVAGIAAAQAVAQPNQTAAAGGGSADGSDAGGSATDATAGAGSGSGSSAPKADPKQTFDDLGEKTSDFDKLKTPASPAFTLLGVAPTDIERPSTPKAVALAFGQFISGTSIVVPKNFALEVSPYWLMHHPDLTLAKYQKEAGLRWLRTLAFSVGTSQTTRSELDAMGSATDHTDSDVAVGFRSMLYQSDFSTECIDAVTQYAQALNSAVELTKDDRAALDKDHKRGSPDWNKAAAKLLQQKYDAIDDEKKKMLATPKCISDGTLVRGWTVDLAAAFDELAKDSKLTSQATSWHRAGAWINAAYDWTDWSAAAMVRFAAQNEMMTTQQVIDAGARGFYKGKKYAVSAEALVRVRLDTNSGARTYKADVAAEYEVSDDTWLSVSFGKDFTFGPGQLGSLFTLANLQWNLGTPQIGK